MADFQELPADLPVPRVITKVFYPVFPPDRNARDVLGWIEAG